MASNAGHSTPPRCANPADLFTPDAHPNPSSLDTRSDASGASSPLSDAPDSDNSVHPAPRPTSPTSPLINDDFAKYDEAFWTNPGRVEPEYEYMHPLNMSPDHRASNVHPLDMPWPTPLRQGLPANDDKPMDLGSVNPEGGDDQEGDGGAGSAEKAGDGGTGGAEKTGDGGAGGAEKAGNGGAGGNEQAYSSEEEVDELESSKPPTPAHTIITPTTLHLFPPLSLVNADYGSDLEYSASSVRRPPSFNIFNLHPRSDAVRFDVDGDGDDNSNVDLGLDLAGPTDDDGSTDLGLDLAGPTDDDGSTDPSIEQVGGRRMREATPPKTLTPTRLRAHIVATERAAPSTMEAIERRRIPADSFMPHSPPPPSASVLFAPASSPTPLSSSSRKPAVATKSTNLARSAMGPPPDPAAQERPAAAKRSRTYRGAKTLGATASPPAQLMGPPPPPPRTLLPPPPLVEPSTPNVFQTGPAGSPPPPPRTLLPPPPPVESSTPNVFQMGPAGSPPPIPPEQFHGGDLGVFIAQGEFSRHKLPLPPSSTAPASLTVIDNEAGGNAEDLSMSQPASDTSGDEGLDAGGRTTNAKQEVLDSCFDTMMDAAQAAANDTGYALSRVLKAFVRQHIDSAAVGRSANKWNGYQAFGNRTPENRIQERRRAQPDYIFENHGDPTNLPPPLTHTELRASWTIFQREYTPDTIQEILDTDRILGIVEGRESLAARQRVFMKFVAGVRRKLEGGFDRGYQSLLFMAGTHVNEDGELAAMVGTGGLEHAFSSKLHMNRDELLAMVKSAVYNTTCEDVVLNSIAEGAPLHPEPVAPPNIPVRQNAAASSSKVKLEGSIAKSGFDKKEASRLAIALGQLPAKCFSWTTLCPLLAANDLRILCFPMNARLPPLCKSSKASSDLGQNERGAIIHAIDVRNDGKPVEQGLRVERHVYRKGDFVIFSHDYATHAPLGECTDPAVRRYWRSSSGEFVPCADGEGAVRGVEFDLDQVPVSKNVQPFPAVVKGKPAPEAPSDKVADVKGKGKGKAKPQPKSKQKPASEASSEEDNYENQATTSLPPPRMTRARSAAQEQVGGGSSLKAVAPVFLKPAIRPTPTNEHRKTQPAKKSVRLVIQDSDSDDDNLPLAKPRQRRRACDKPDPSPPAKRLRPNASEGSSKPIRQVLDHVSVPQLTQLCPPLPQSLPRPLLPLWIQYWREHSCSHWVWTQTCSIIMKLCLYMGKVAEDVEAKKEEADMLAGTAVVGGGGGGGRRRGGIGRRRHQTYPGQIKLDSERTSDPNETSNSDISQEVRRTRKMETYQTIRQLERGKRKHESIHNAGEAGIGGSASDWRKTERQWAAVGEARRRRGGTRMEGMVVRQRAWGLKDGSVYVVERRIGKKLTHYSQNNGIRVETVVAQGRRSTLEKAQAVVHGGGEGPAEGKDSDGRNGVAVKSVVAERWSVWVAERRIEKERTHHGRNNGTRVETVVTQGWRRGTPGKAKAVVHGGGEDRRRKGRDSESRNEVKSVGAESRERMSIDDTEGLKHIPHQARSMPGVSRAMHFHLDVKNEEGNTESGWNTYHIKQPYQARSIQGVSGALHFHLGEKDKHVRHTTREAGVHTESSKIHTGRIGSQHFQAYSRRVYREPGLPLGGESAAG
ncbi:hypothetical protein C8R44DRAFT_727227 [Mycena epipterygia]|nr:hypothetical protein C8R44DRAFT_727227 [Mycena epipterygia]